MHSFPQSTPFSELSRTSLVQCSGTQAAARTPAVTYLHFIPEGQYAVPREATPVKPQKASDISFRSGGHSSYRRVSVPSLILRAAPGNVMFEPPSLSVHCMGSRTRTYPE